MIYGRLIPKQNEGSLTATGVFCVRLPTSRHIAARPQRNHGRV
jgi:hypothetical protein